MPVSAFSIVDSMKPEPYYEYNLAKSLGFFAETRWNLFRESLDQMWQQRISSYQKESGAKKAFSRKQRERLSKHFSEIIRGPALGITAFTELKILKKGGYSLSCYGVEKFHSDRGRLYFFGTQNQIRHPKVSKYQGRMVLTGHLVERLSERAFQGVLTGEESLADLILFFADREVKITSQRGCHVNIGWQEKHDFGHLRPEIGKKLLDSIHLIKGEFLPGTYSDDGRPEIVMRHAKGILLGELILADNGPDAPPLLIHLYKTFVSNELLSLSQVALISDLERAVVAD